MSDLVSSLLTLLLPTAGGAVPADVYHALDAATNLLGLSACVDDVLLPAVRLMRCGVQQNPGLLMADELIRTWVDLRTFQLPTPDHRAPVLLACGPRDAQVIGPELLALLLRRDRQAVRTLGARVSVKTLTIAASATGSRCVVVFSEDPRGWAAAVSALEAAAKAPLSVFYAGAAFDAEATRGASGAARGAVPGVRLPASMAAAAALLAGFGMT